MTLLPRMEALVLAASSVWAAPALAVDCRALKLLNSTDLEPLGSSGLMLVPVTIDGVPKKMLLDIAGGVTGLYPTAIDALKLHPVDTGGSFRLLSSDGGASARYVELQSLQLDRMAAKNVDVMVAPGFVEADAPFDGVISGDLINHYDVELDFAGNKMNYFSPDHCEGRVVYWPSGAIAMVPFHIAAPARASANVRGMSVNADTRIRVPVTLDGKNFNAVISTGTNSTTMSADVAKRVFSLTPASKGATPLDKDDPDNKAFSYVFDRLSFGGVVVRHLPVSVIPDLTGQNDRNNSPSTGSRIGHADDGLGEQLTVGLDVLENLHLYIAYGERRLYITPAGPPGADATPPQAPAPAQDNKSDASLETITITASRHDNEIYAAPAPTSVASPATLDYTPVIRMTLDQQNAVGTTAGLAPNIAAPLPK